MSSQILASRSSATMPASTAVRLRQYRNLAVGDIVIRTSDSVKSHVHHRSLSNASPVFAKGWRETSAIRDYSPSAISPNDRPLLSTTFRFSSRYVASTAWSQ